MTEEEFLMSLPFTLSTKEREKRLKEWREENPPKLLETPTEEKEEDQGPAQPTKEEQDEADRINRVNTLYARYNKDLERSAFMSDEEEQAYENAANATIDQKIEWLNNNTRTDQSYDDVDTSEGWDSTFDLITLNLFNIDEEAETADQMS